MRRLRSPILALSGLLLFFLSAVAQEHLRLSLVEALAMAEDHDKGLENARLDISEADQLVREATSGALPGVNLKVAAGRYVIAPTSHIPALGSAPIRLTPYNDMSLTLGLAQPIWLAGKVGLALDAARAYRRLSRVNIQTTQADLKKQVTQEYFRYVLAIESVRLLSETAEQAQHHADQAQKFFDVGMISEFDLLRAQTEAKAVEPELLRARQGVELAKMMMTNRLGLAPETEIEPTDSLSADNVPGLNAGREQAYSDALRTRPEFRALDLVDELQRISLQVEKRSLYWPNVMFSFGLVKQSQVDRFQDMDKGESWTTGARWDLSVSVPLFNGFASQARIEKAKIGVRRVKLQRRQLEDGVRLEVSGNLTELRRASEQITSQQAALNLAERAYKIAGVRYEQGIGTEIELQDSRLALSRARLQLLQGLYDLRIARAEYSRVIESDNKLTLESER